MVPHVELIITFDEKTFFSVTKFQQILSTTDTANFAQMTFHLKHFYSIFTANPNQGQCYKTF
jgi:hypothetical protein